MYIALNIPDSVISLLCTPTEKQKGGQDNDKHFKFFFKFMAKNFQVRTGGVLVFAWRRDTTLARVLKHAACSSLAE
jgi:hypothetical protein